ncbi:MAG: TatD family deoxyribonuclease [Spartobacteria bacterium]|nr:TatD family deoxyribonuclease [Spartobacteria bacterium]
MPPDSQNLVWIDAHAHLQDPRLAPHLPQVFARAAAAGVARIHVDATCEADWPAVAALADAQPSATLVSFGVHPWFIRDRSARWLQNLRDVLAARPAGIGEIGLDARMGDSLDADREAVFRAQLELSHELALPASLHCRDAWEPMLKILLAAPPHPAGLLIHAYSGPPDALPALAEKNVHVSFGGTLTRPKNVRARENAARVPAGRFLLESDAPDLPPTLPAGAEKHLVGEDGKLLSEPAYVPWVGQIVAEVRGTTPGAIAAETTATARRLFAKLWA